MTSLEFEQWWASLTEALAPATQVFHWSAHSQFQLDGSFEVSAVGSDRVWIDIGRHTTPSDRTATKRVQRTTVGDILAGRHPKGSAKEVPINCVTYLPKENFRNALKVWGDYCNGTIARKSMDDKIGGGSTYVISVIHWMEMHSK